MSDMFIVKEILPAMVEQLMGRHRVFGPVLKGQYHEFAALETAAELDLTFRNTRLSPKALFHPHSERMFHYSLEKGDPEAGILKEAPKDYSSRVVFGIRPCDAVAFKLDDRNFVNEQFKDPWWAKRRESTILIGLACDDPCSTCFCTSTGTGPFDTTGLDALLVDLGDGYLLQAVTGKGKDLLSSLQGGVAAPENAAERVAAIKKSAEGQLGVQFNLDPIKGKSMVELFEAPFWDEVQFSCINCGTCTFLCPTCWCFDIQDEVYGERGDRIRIWDSCMFPLFTLHGAGHNPRSQKLQRVRQRFMHKLKYYPDKYSDGIACVGCGRCVRHCPVNIDIRQVARLMSESCICPV
jgi:sulfhydrogenase subunit beta (sulfur reductase)